MACGELFQVDIKQSGSWVACDAFVGRVLLTFPVGMSSSWFPSFGHVPHQPGSKPVHVQLCGKFQDDTRASYLHLHHSSGCVVYLFRQLGWNWPLPWASGLPVAIQCAWNLEPSVPWNAAGECQCASSGLPMAFQWSSSVFQLCKLTLDRHWDTTGC